LISASKTTLSHYNLKILRPKVTKNIKNLYKKFCECPPRILQVHKFDSTKSNQRVLQVCNLTIWQIGPQSCCERITFVVNLSFADQEREKKSGPIFCFEEINDVHWNVYLLLRVRVFTSNEQTSNLNEVEKNQIRKLPFKQIWS